MEKCIQTRTLRSAIPAALLLFLPLLVQAQVTCTASVPAQPVLRQEGIAEPAADILIACQGTQAGLQSIALSASAPITSRPLVSYAWAFDSVPTEAALLINDSTASPIQGFLENGSLVFDGFPLPTAGTFTLRITNLRIDANATSPGATITGKLASTFSISNGAALPLGTVATSLNVTLSSAPNYSGCAASSNPVQILTISELIGTAFKPAASSAANNTPGGWYQSGFNSESQTIFPIPATWNCTLCWSGAENQGGGPIPGQANSATRIRVSLSNIPAGVTVLLPVTVNSSSGAGTLTATTGGDLGTYNAAPGTTIPVTSSGSITYQVTRGTGSTVDSFPIPMTISIGGNAGPGPIYIAVTYAATSSESSSSIPLFADTSAPAKLASFTDCRSPNHLAFTGQTFRGPVGSAIPPVFVQVQDSNGNLVSSGAGITVSSVPAGAAQTVPAANGVATFGSLVFNASGYYALAASATGLTSAVSGPVLIAGSPTNTSLATSGSPSIYGRNTALTANVSPATSTGSVTFFDGASILGIKPVSNGSATSNTMLLPSGKRSLTALYGGDSSHAPSTSSVVAQTVSAVAASGFTSAVSYTLGINPWSMVLGDFNGDGKQDLAIADYGAGAASIMLGNGDGTFQTAVNYDLDDTPLAVAAGDFNGDGKQDLAFANGDNVSILLGNGDGTFRNGAVFPAGTSPVWVSAGDLNGDGITDLVVADNLASSVNVLLGNGGGTFQAPISSAVPGAPIAIAVGDFNGDGKADVAVVNSALTILLGNGDGTFRSPINYSVGTSPSAIAAGDFNADGKLDLAVTNQGDNNVSVFTGNGDGTFRAPATFPVGISPSALVVADFDGDGKSDIAVSNQGGVNVSILAGNGSGGFLTAVPYGAGAAPTSLVAGDFNGDGRTDLAITNKFGGMNVILGRSAYAPALSIAASHAGNFQQGQTGALYTITVSNTGTLSTSGTVTVTESIPTGLTLVSMSGPGWTCASTTCTRGDALAPATSYPVITVAVNVSSSAPSPLANQVSASGGGSVTPASAMDTTVVISPAQLSITKSHAGSFTQGQSGATYSVTVSNAASAGPTSGTVTVTENIPTGLTLVSMSGTGWTCSSATCTRSDALAPAASYPIITVTVNVAANAPTSLANQVTASSGGSINPASATDTTVVISLAQLSITKSHAGSFTQGQSGATYAVTVSNGASAAPTSGTVTVTDTIPSGLTLVSMSGAGWTCAGNNCTRGDSLSAGASYPAITVTVNVSSTAPSSATNSVTVWGGGSASASASDPTTIIPVADLTVSKSHSGNFIQGQTGAAYSITVTNRGVGSTAGTVTITDSVPAGLTATTLSGTGWTCNVTTVSCTRSDTLAAGSSYPAITLTVSVAANAPSNITNTATVSGGGELNTGNDIATDTATIVPLTVISNVTSSSSNGTYAAGQSISIQVSFSQNVTVTGAPTLTLNSGGTAGYNSGSGTSTLTFTYLVGSSDSSPHLDYTSSGALAVNGGSIIDAASNAAVLTLPAPGATGSLGANKSFVIAPPGMRFVAMPPCRVVDTRWPAGPFGAPGLSNNSRDFPVPSGSCGIPSTATAYALNVTVVPNGPVGYLSIWPTGKAQPFVSTLNSFDGRVKANAAIVPAGTNGSVSVYTNSITDVLLDISGYFTSDPTQLTFYPATPCRVVDTRNPTGTFGGPDMAANETRSFPISSGGCNIPLNAAAYSLNITVVPHGPLAYLAAWPTGQAQSAATTLNAPTTAITANAAFVQAGTNGAISVNVSSSTTVVIDINGYFAPNNGSGLSFYPVTPCRTMDTRNPTGPLGGPTLYGQRDFPLSTSSCGLPATAQAYSLNATVVPETVLGYLSLWPTGLSMPLVSTLNALDGSVVANAAIVPAAGGSISAYAFDPTALILDTNGYFGR